LVSAASAALPSCQTTLLQVLPTNTHTFIVAAYVCPSTPDRVTYYFSLREKP